MPTPPENSTRQPFLAVLGDKGLERLRAEGANPHKLCEQSHLLWAPPAQMRRHLEKGSILQYRPSAFPHGPFRREYEYLGDHPVGSNVFFDVRLRNHGPAVRYSLNGDLPPGLVFDRGIVFGRVYEGTPILHFTVIAETPAGSEAKSYMIRFYAGPANVAKTFTEGNYLRAGCGPAMIDHAADQTYYRLIPDPLPAPVSPLEAARRAALWVKSEAGSQPICLFASGGIDSQCMIQAFLSANVDFKCVFMRDTGGSNEMDFVYFQKFIAKYPAPFEMIDVNYREFLDSYRYVPMAHRYRFNNPEYGILLHLMDLYPRCFPVYAGRPIAASPFDERSHLLSLCGDENLSKARYLERNGRNGCVEFISCTPLLVSSFLEMRKLKLRPLGAPWIYRDKIDLLQEAGFDTSLAPPTKGTGFEELQNQFSSDEYGNQLWTMHRGPLKSVYSNPLRRNAIRLRSGKLADDGFSVVRPFPDGFSWDYVTKNDVRDFH